MWAGARPGMDVERKYTSFYYWGMSRASPVIVRTQAFPVGNAMPRRVKITWNRRLGALLLASRAMQTTLS